MVDSELERKARYRDTLSKWSASPRRVADATERKRLELFDAFAAYVYESGGWITSIPGARDIKLEIPRGSALVGKLTDLGYVMRLVGSNQ